jgi:hypothetical protein
VQRLHHRVTFWLLFGYFLVTFWLLFGYFWFVALRVYYTLTVFVVVWGNAGFGPTSRGHVSAPNRKLQLALSRYLPVVVASEFRSSQTSTCHHCCVRPVRRKDQKTKSHCVEVFKLFYFMNFNAAHVTADTLLVTQATPQTPKFDRLKYQNYQVVGIPTVRSILALINQLRALVIWYFIDQISEFWVYQFT